eukprot:6485413-Amphidinium_carterae.1
MARHLTASKAWQRIILKWNTGSSTAPTTMRYVHAMLEPETTETTVCQPYSRNSTPNWGKLVHPSSTFSEIINEGPPSSAKAAIV